MSSSEVTLSKAWQLVLRSLRLPFSGSLSILGTKRFLPINSSVTVLIKFKHARTNGSAVEVRLIKGRQSSYFLLFKALIC